MEAFVQWLLENSVKGAALAILVWALTALFSNKISPRWKCFLWALVAVRLLMPGLLPARFSLYNMAAPFFTAKPAPAKIQAPAPAAPPEMRVLSPAALTSSTNVPAKRVFSVWEIVFMVWAAGAGSLAAMVLYRHFSISIKAASRRPLTNQALLDLLEDCKEQTGVRAPVSVVSTDIVQSPALMGFVRPRILLPTDMEKNTAPEDMRHIFLHELAHLKRKDVALNWLLTAVQIMHWFNPAAWFAFRRLRAEREQACDAAALSLIKPGDRKKYGLTIIKMIEFAPRQNSAASMAGIFEDKQQLKRRIEMIGKFKGKSFGVILALALLTGLSALCLSDAKSNDRESVPAAKTETPEKSLSITADSLSVSGNEVTFSGNAKVTIPGAGIVAGDKFKFTSDSPSNLIHVADPPSTNMAEAEKPGKSPSASNAMTEKLKSIIFDRVDFESVPLRPAISYLISRSKNLDPQKTGVNLILLMTDKQSDAVEITMCADNIPLGDLIKYICAAGELKFRVDEHAVVIYQDNGSGKSDGK